jgi:ribonucleoside-diphosphate reductase beta chain
MTRLAGYEHFARVAERLRWDDAGIDLDADAAAWPRLGPARRRRIEAFVAAFRLAEERVAVDLAPFVDAAPDPAMAECFRLQERDEERHSRFFARYEREVIPTRDPGAAVPAPVAALFEDRLRSTAAALADDGDRLGEAVALYHLVLEGVVFSAGQAALMAELEHGGPPGLREGLGRVVADERWHIGFGARVVQDCGLGDGEARALGSDGAEAVEAWGGLVPRERRDAAVLLHERRLRAAGIAGT